MGEKKHGDLRLLAPGKPCFHMEKASTEMLAKTGLTQALASPTPVSPPAAAAVAAYAYRRRQCGTPDAMSDPGCHRPPWSVAEVLGTGRPPNGFVGALSARFRLTGPDGNPLSTDLQKGGEIHAFLCRLTAEVAPVPGSADLMLVGAK